MDTAILERHFADCDLPVKFLNEDPRLPRPGWPRVNRFTRPEDFSFIDVLTARPFRQTFRVFVDSSAEMHVMDKNEGARHLLLQMRCEPRGQSTEATLHFLAGHDERQLFVVQSRGVSSVRAALLALKPAEVEQAERRGLKVVRQGDWFFIPMRQKFQLTPEMILHRGEPIGGPNFGRWGLLTRHPHMAEEQALVFGTRYIPDARGRRPLENQLIAIYVRGKIHHEEHATVELHGWYRAVQNMAPRATPALGYLD